MLAQLEGQSELCAVWRRYVLRPNIVGYVMLAGGRRLLLCWPRGFRLVIFGLCSLTRVVDFIGCAVLAEVHGSLVDVV
jgi:hypothetical protein